MECLECSIFHVAALPTSIHSDYIKKIYNWKNKDLCWRNSVKADTGHVNISLVMKSDAQYLLRAQASINENRINSLSSTTFLKYFFNFSYSTTAINTGTSNPIWYV